MTVNSLSLTPAKPQRQAGYTLIELSITLSIIAVLLVGTLTGVQRLLQANDTNNTIATTQAAISNITRIYKATADKSIYSTETLTQMGVWDSSVATMSGTSATVRNPYDGKVTVFENGATVGAVASGAAANTGYWYRIGGVPKGACASLVTSFTNSADGIYINAASLTTGTGTTGLYKVPGVAANNNKNLADGCALGNTVEVSLFILSWA